MLLHHSLTESALPGTGLCIHRDSTGVANMVSRKRTRDEMESSEPAVEPSMLDKLRNTWELANLMQYIYIFGKAVKIDEDLTIEVPFPKLAAISSIFRRASSSV